MADTTAKQRHSMRDEEIRNVKVSFADVLDAGELLNGTPTATILPAGPNIDAGKVAVSTALETINGKRVAIGEAILFEIDALTGVYAVVSGTEYTITVTAPTDGGQTLKQDLILTGE